MSKLDESSAETFSEVAATTVVSIGMALIKIHDISHVLQLEVSQVKTLSRTSVNGT